MINLLSQLQLIGVSFFTSFFFSFIFLYLYRVYLLSFVKLIRFISVIAIFLLVTLLYFYFCLIVYDGVFSMYQVVFIFLGILCFYYFYYPLFNRFIEIRRICVVKHIEKIKNTLYNLLKKMGGIFSGRSRKKRQEDCSDD